MYLTEDLLRRSTSNVLNRGLVKEKYPVTVVGSFFLPLNKNMLWVLIRSASARCY